MATEPGVIRIDLNAPTPAYRQISDAIRARLVAGELKPGDLLPPVRQLAMDLTVHFNTVAEAYRSLADEGWLDLRRRRGAQVLDRRTPKNVSRESEATFVQRLREFVAATRSAGLPPKMIAQHLRRVAEGIDPC